MDQIAHLIIRVDSNAGKASVDLDKLVASAVKATEAMNRLSLVNSGLTNAYVRMIESADKVAISKNKVKDSSNGVAIALARQRISANNLESSHNRLATSYNTLETSINRLKVENLKLEQQQIKERISSRALEIEVKKVERSYNAAAIAASRLAIEQVKLADAATRVRLAELSLLESNNRVTISNNNVVISSNKVSLEQQKVARSTNEVTASENRLSSQRERSAAIAKRLELEYARLALQSERLAKTNQNLSTSSSTLTGYFNRLIAATVSYQTVTRGISGLKNTLVALENYEARLGSATGSTEEATQALIVLRDFDRNSPLNLQQTIAGFLNLVNLGLDPSERAMKSLGDIAYATGTDIETMAFRVQRATAGEFRPLRAMGIAARVDGENLRITFRGVTEVIRNNAQEINEWFIKLGEAKFAGAMERGMLTLGGSLGKLESAWLSMQASIGKAGASDYMIKWINRATTAVDEFEIAISSGQAFGYIEATEIRFSQFFGEIKSGFGDLTSWINTEFSIWSDQGLLASEIIEDAFTFLPENIVWAFKQIGIGWAENWGSIVNIIEKDTALLAAHQAVKQAGIRFPSSVGLDSSGFDAEAWIAAKNSKDFTAAQKKVIEEQGEIVQAANRRRVEQDNIIEKVGNENTIKNLEELEAKKKVFRDRIAAADAKREAYEAEKRANAELHKFFGGDRLAKYDLGADNEEASRQSRSSFNQLIGRIGTDEQQIEEAYANNLRLITENTAGNVELFNRYSTLVWDEAQEKLLKVLEKKRTELQEQQDRELNQNEIFYKIGITGYKQYLENIGEIEARYGTKLGNLRVGVGLKNLKGESGSISGLTLPSLKTGDEGMTEAERKQSKDDIEFNRLESKYETELRMLNDSREAMKMTDEEYTRQSRQLWNEYTQDLAKISTTGALMVYTKNLEMSSTVLGMSATIAGQLDQLAQGQGDAAKATFLAVKSISIAQAIINTELAATRAYVEGGVFAGIPMAVAIRGLGYASVAIMAATSAQEYSGKFAEGGFLGGSQTTGDRVLFHGNAGEAVLNGQQQRNFMALANGQVGGRGGQPIVNVHIYNTAAGVVSATTRKNEMGDIEVLIEELDKRGAANIMNGSSRQARALEKTHGIRRVGLAS